MVKSMTQKENVNHMIDSVTFWRTKDDFVHLWNLPFSSESEALQQVLNCLLKESSIHISYVEKVFELPIIGFVN